MLNFECDYNNGAHPEVLRKLVETNGRQSLTYGFDEWSEQARGKIRAACGDASADVFFLVGGTQTNATVIDALLRSHEAVISAECGHINVHEAGAIEQSGHKVIALPACDGKMRTEDLEHYMDWFVNDESRDHVAQPGMVYVTFPTEFGTLYTARELQDIHNVCRKYGLKLFVDGARMGYGLAASSEVTLPFLAQHSDAFYIGGTKVGALCGEAVVFPRGGAPKGFFSIIKQHGALLAKGRLAGIQFDALFTDNLYLNISRHAVSMAMRLKEMMLAKGYRLHIDSPTNQQFFVIENSKMHELEPHVLFTHWEPADEEHTVCRFVTSWATTEEDLQALAEVV
ncbi:MAG: aminotransferase class I/II-fold pyridoxal phosphate-dependent enzyme [Prevotella sp.]|nr:aminotransferase class I/II-fold pyridoxal phosphate-dependent enzyme [Prevotella sp.]MBR7013596.1 aminotransferase class I/II-fold pyridoxal phosphate-dependent enzyme [Prevotella sp.]MBR7094133.1 aminotransferase class I/II-fold pyridoxal phosphate-dependent enzyme [Prevotella sp.]